MTKRRSKLGGGALGDQGPSSIEEFDEAMYGALNQADSGREVVRAVHLSAIWPDHAQPRRVISASVRRDWNGDPGRIGPVFNRWSAMATERSGVNMAQLADEIIGGEGETDVEVDDPIAVQWLDVVRLAASIKADGLQNAITVWEDDDGRYRIETGERRWVASLLLRELKVKPKVEKIKARVVEPSVWAQAAENGRRQSLNAIGMARQLALLIMEMWKGEHEFIPYIEMIVPGESDRPFYAQVSELRVRRGYGQRVLDATGLKSAAQVNQYKRLLSIDDDLWTKADEENWTEYAIRTHISEVTTPSDQRDTLTAVKVTDSTQEQYTGRGEAATAHYDAPNPDSKPNEAIPYPDFSGGVPVDPSVVVGGIGPVTRVDEEPEADMAALAAVQQASASGAQLRSVSRESMERLADQTLMAILHGDVNGVVYDAETLRNAQEVLDSRKTIAARVSRLNDRQREVYEDFVAKYNKRPVERLGLFASDVYPGETHEAQGARAILSKLQRDQIVGWNASWGYYQLCDVEDMERLLTQDELEILQYMTQVGSMTPKALWATVREQRPAVDVNYLIKRGYLTTYNDEDGMRYKYTDMGWEVAYPKPEPEPALESTEPFAVDGFATVLSQLSKIVDNSDLFKGRNRDATAIAATLWRRANPEKMRKEAMACDDPQLGPLEEEWATQYQLILDAFTTLLNEQANQMLDSARAMRAKYGGQENDEQG